MSKERDEIRVVPTGTTGTPIKSEKDIVGGANANSENVPEHGSHDRAVDIKIEDNKTGATEGVKEEKEKRELTPQEIAMKRAERKARLAIVLDRGVLNERFRVELPPHLHGEWARNDPMEIDRLRSYGFWVDEEYAPKRSIHSDGSNAGIVGDVIHMVCDIEDYKIIEELRHERAVAMHGKPGQDIAGEERSFAQATRAETGGEIKTFTESSTYQIRKAELERAMKNADAQTPR